MGLRTYKHTFKHGLLEKTVGIKAKKDLAKAIISRLDRLANINKYTHQLTGIKGETEGFYKESSSLIMSFFMSSGESGKTLVDQGAFDIEYNEWISHLPDLITAENLQEVVESADKIFNRHVIEEDNRRTPEEETERITKSNKREEERKAEAAKQKAKDDIEQAALIPKYPYLVQTGDKYPNQALASKNIKIELQRAFPGQKFSVTSDSFSMGDSVNIHWTEGPTTKEVEEFTDKYQHSDFDGMQDMSIGRKYGGVFRGLFGSSKYVSCNRTITDETVIAACEKLGLTYDKNWNYEHWDRVALNEAVNERSYYVRPETPLPTVKPASGHVEADTDALCTIEEGHAEGHLFFLPDRHLAREEYVAANKVLKALGGKWNRKQKAHVFDRDIEAEMQAVIESGSVYDKKKDLQIFETPPEVAQQMIGLAEIDIEHTSINGDVYRILEPSAGTGNLLRAMPYGPQRVAVEIDHENAEKLKGLAEVYEMDFLQCNGNLGHFDRVIMNPPFKNGMDIKHIEHAEAHLKPGGRLVALCANGPRQQAAFQDRADYWEELPAGSFKAEGTNVSVALMVLTN